MRLFYFNRRFVSLFTALILSLPAIAQVPNNQDCMGAIPVCQNSYYQGVSYSGTGNYPNEIPTSGGCPNNCMLSGELNDVWYTFTVQTTGWLNFSIIPNSWADDYDWALYNLTTDNCSSLANVNSMPWLQTSCNWSADDGLTGANNQAPNTGGDCGSASDPANNSAVWVTSGETYYLNVSNFSSTQSGYQLDFAAGTATIFDNVPPYLSNVTTPVCGATSITLVFSENVLCSTVSTGDFSLTGPGAPSITSVVGAVCALGGTNENTFTLNLSSPLLAGNYQLCLTGTAGNVSDNCGNLSTTSNPANCTNFTVTGISVSVNPGSSTICAGQSVALLASGATTYTWSPGGGLSCTNCPNPNASPGSTTTYTVTGSTAGCSAMATTTITVNPSPTVTVSPGSPSICAGGSVVLTASGAISYSWAPGTGLSCTNCATPTANPGTTTTYTVTGTTGACTGSATVTVTVNPIPVVSVNPGAPAICTGGSVALTASGATSYTWAPATGLSCTNCANPNANPASTTTYTVIGTSAGCTGSTTVTVTVSPSLVVSVLPASPSICSGDSVALSASGATTYSWAPATGLSCTNCANPNANPASTTTYTVTGTSGGCTGTATVTVTVNSGPLVSIVPASPSICAGGSVALTASGATSYSWTPATGLSCTNCANPNANPGSTTTYTVTGTTGACTGSATVTVTVNPIPVVLINPGSSSICAGGTVALTASGASTYSWSPGGGLSCTNCPNPNANPGSTTTYTVTGTSLGCTGSASVTVTVDPIPVVSVTPSAPTICIGGSVVLTANGATNYSWTPGGGLSCTNCPNPTANPAATTTYTVTGTTSGCTGSTSVIVTINPLPTANAGIDVIIGSCVSSFAFLNGNGTGTGIIYTWTPTNGLSNPNISNPTAQPNISTTYTLTVTDLYGCTASDNIIINLDPLPSANAGPDGAIGSCPASTYTLAGFGSGTGISYQWTPTSGLSNSGIPGPVAKPGSTTNYTLIVTDTYGCQALDVVTVTVSPLPTISVTPANPAICVGGSVTLTASGASIYSWLPGTGLTTTSGPTVGASPLLTTTYTVTGTDIYGCTASASITVIVTPNPVINLIPSNPVICATSSVVLNAFGATTFVWTPAGGLSGTSGPVVTASPMTTVTYTVIGTSGTCTASTAVTVTVNPLPIVSFSALSDVCQNSAAFALNGGNPVGGYYTGPGVTGSSFNPVTAGPGIHQITYTYTDSNNCSNTAIQNITVLQAPAITVSPANPSLCLGASLVLSANGAVSYTWSPPSGLSSTSGNSVTANPVVTTTYTVTGDDGTCTGSTTITIDIYNGLSISVIPSDAEICPGSAVTLTAMGGDIYSWTPPAGLSDTVGSSVIASPDVPTIYTVFGSDLYGCIGNASVLVDIYPESAIVFTAEPSEGCAPLTVQFSFLPGPNIMDSSWIWHFGDPAGGNNTSTALNPTHTYNNLGNYIVTLDAVTEDGCLTSFRDTIHVYKAPVADFFANPAITDLDHALVEFYDQSGYGSNWYWIFGDPGSNSADTSTLPNPQHLFSDTGSFNVMEIVGNEHGCYDTAFHTIIINDIFAIYASSGFTPNEDGRNDIFLPKGVGIKPGSFELYIFDRWGKMMFQSKDLNIGWDGTDEKSGKYCNEGVYTWVIYLRELSGIRHKYMGTVTLYK